MVDNTLAIGEFLVLTAKVADASGAAAQDGRITYEYCDLSNVKVQSSECVYSIPLWVDRARRCGARLSSIYMKSLCAEARWPHGRPVAGFVLVHGREKLPLNSAHSHRKHPVCSCGSPSGGKRRK